MTQPNARIYAAAKRAEQFAPRFTEALKMITQVLSCADETSSAEKVHTSGVTSSTESVALRRYEATSWREDLRDHLDDWLNTTDLFAKFIEDVIAWSHRTLGTSPAALTVVTLCDGKAKGYDGHQLPWVSHSRDPLNGWHDPNCREIADATGLCPRCKVRMNRWRTEHGMEPVAVMPADARRTA